MIAEPLSRREEPADDELLRLYLEGNGPGSEAAFRALVERHGPMVLGTCRHVLNQLHDAEDAFQATFLALARKGASIRDRKALAGWLHEVAHRTAVTSRGRSLRRRALERRSLAMSPHEFEADDQETRAASNELRPLLHEEIDRLPEPYRVAVVLSYLEGRTNEEVAGMLDWPVGTVKGRLSRARGLLRSRLSRRGVALSAAFLAMLASRGRAAAGSLPPELVRETVRLAMDVGPPPTGPGPSPPTDPRSPVVEAGVPETPSSTVGSGKDVLAKPAETSASRRIAALQPGRRGVVFMVFFFFFWAVLSVTIGLGMSMFITGEGLSGIHFSLPVQVLQGPRAQSSGHCH